MNSPVIKMENVTKKFKKTIALDDVSFDVPSGCVFALLGENGAGKTTTIKSLLGLEKPDSGRVEVLGMSSQKDAVQIRRTVGYVAENPKLYDWMTVDQVGWFVAGFYPEGYYKHYLQMTEQFELPLARKIKTLSKGMRAKVSLSLAMSHQPELLILDEPTSGLDAMVRRSFLESMVDVAAEGRTVFLCSHQINEVERVADRVAIMSGGKLLACEPLVDLKQRMEQWVVSTDATTLPEIEAEIISERWKTRRCQLIVSNPSPEALWRLRDDPNTIDVEVHTPSLEEIFVALMELSNKTGDAQSETSPTADQQEAGAMNQTLDIAKRLMWKESIQLIPLVIAMTSIAVVVIGATYLLPDSNQVHPTVLAAAGVSCFFAVMIAILLFVSEKESRTIEFLYQLPVKPAQLGLVKLILGIVVTIIFVLAVKLGIWNAWSSYQQQFSQYDSYAATNYWISIGLPAIEFFLWTCLFSILLRSTLHAAFLGILMASSVTFFTCAVFFGRFAPEHAAELWGMRLVIVALLAASVLALAMGWSSVSRAQPVKLASGIPFARFQNKLAQPRAFRRLYWLSQRHSSYYLLWLPVLIPITYLGMRLFKNQDRDPYVEPLAQVTELSIAVGFVPIVVGMLTSLTFASEQLNHGKNFFVQNFERPRLLWFSHILSWIVFFGTGVFACAIIVIAIWSWLAPSTRFDIAMLFPASRVIWPSAGLMMTGMIGAFAIGQLCSMYVRQPVIACCVSIPLVIAFLIWAQAMQFMMLSPFWSVFPIVIGCFIATWWASPQWISGTQRLRYWLKPVVAIGLPAVLICCAIPYARVAQVPEPQLQDYAQEYGWSASDGPRDQWWEKNKRGFDQQCQRLTSPKALEAAELYKQALALYQGFDRSRFKPFSLPVGVIDQNTLGMNLRLRWIPENNEFAIEMGTQRLSTIDLPADLYQPHVWPDEVLHDFLAKNKPCIECLDKADAIDDCFPFLPECGNSAPSRLTVLYLAQSTREIRRSNLEGSLDYLLKGFNALLRGNPENEYIVSNRTVLFFDRLGAWSEHPDQTPVLLRKASLELITNYRNAMFGSAVEHWGPRRHRGRRHRGRRHRGLWLVRFEQAAKKLHNTTPIHLEFGRNWMYRLPWEKTRAQKLARLYAANSDFIEREFATHVKSGGYYEEFRPRDPKLDRIERLKKSSAMSFPRPGRSSKLQLHTIQYVNAVILKFEIMRFKLANGKYPQYFMEIDFPEEKLYPLGVTYYDFHPRGFPYEIRCSSSIALTANGTAAFDEIVIPRNQPFISPFRTPSANFRTSKYVSLDDDQGVLAANIEYAPKVWFLPKLEKKD